MTEYEFGARDFAVFGAGSLADQVMLVLSELELEGLKFRPVEKTSELKPNDQVLTTDEKIKKVNGNKVINIAEKLSDLYWGVE